VSTWRVRSCQHGVYDRVNMACTIVSTWRVRSFQPCVYKHWRTLSLPSVWLASSHISAGYRHMRHVTKAHHTMTPQKARTETSFSIRSEAHMRGYLLTTCAHASPANAQRSKFVLHNSELVLIRLMYSSRALYFKRVYSSHQFYIRHMHSSHAWYFRPLHCSHL
jgi:hypothetical protein